MNKLPKIFENMKVVTKTCSTIWDEQRIRHSSGSEGDGIAPMGLVCSNTSAETPSGGQFMCFLFALNVHSVLKISLNVPCERVIAAIPFAFPWQPRHISQMDFWIFFISCNNCFVFTNRFLFQLQLSLPSMPASSHDNTISIHN